MTIIAMSTEGDSAKSALSEPSEKSGTDNHTDTSQDSNDVDVKVKEKSEKENVENNVEKKKEEDKPKEETEEESEQESEVSEKTDKPESKKEEKDKKPEENDVKKDESEKKEEKDKLKDEEKSVEGSDKEEEEEEDDSEEEENKKDKKNNKKSKKGVPLLDQPLETTGKRERKNVQRFEEDNATKETKIELEVGSGTPLGEIPRVDASISRFKNDDLKHLHRLLFKVPGKSTLVKRNIKKFNGFDFKKDSDEYKKRVFIVHKFEVKQLKSICEMLDLVKTGSKDEIIERVMDFLLDPKDSGKPVGGGRPKRASAVRANNRGKRQNLKDDSSSDEEFKPDKDSDASEEKPRTLSKRKRGAPKKASSEEEDEVVVSGASSDESDDEPASKKRRSTKVNNKAKSRTPARRGRPKATPKKTPRSTRKRKDSTEEESEDEKMDADDGSSSEDEPLAKKVKSSEPPTDDEIKTFIKSILEGANLEEITMKVVCQRVYAHYPDFDLSHKKDFIKTTVKSLIST